MWLSSKKTKIPDFLFVRAHLFAGIVATIVMCLSPRAHSKEKEVPINRPPSPEPVFTSAYVGETTAIDLPVRGRIEDPLQIIIRKKPRIGSLSEIPERIDRHTVRFWYSVPSGSSEDTDSFTYAAQSVDSPVSVAAPVRISVVKRNAELVCADSLDFGSVPVGETSTQQFDIHNAGGKTATIAPVLRPPWQLLDSTPIKIKGGETTKIRVAFSPGSPGSYADKFVLERDSKRGITLNGASENPLQWPSQEVLFASGHRADAQSVSFRNLTDKARELIFEWPAFLDAPSHITIDPGSSIEVPIRLRAEPAFSWDGTVPFSSANFRGSLAVVIETAPAIITLEPASVLDLGEISLGSAAKGTIKLANSGGRSARLTIDVPNGIKVNPSPVAVLIEPGMTAAFEATATPQKPGTFDFLLPVNSDSRNCGAFQVRATVRAAQPVEKLLAIRVSEPNSPALQIPVADIPPVDECTLLESTTRSIKISWKLTSPDTKSFIIERREIKLEADGQVKTEWKPWEGVHVQISGDSATAYFRKLPADTFWNIRITGIDSKGQLGQQSKRSLRIETQAFNSWTIPFWIWMPSALVLLIALFRWRWKVNLLW